MSPNADYGGAIAAVKAGAIPQGNGDGGAGPSSIRRARLGGGRRLLTETRARDDRRYLGQAKDVLYAFVLDQWKRLGSLMGRLASRS